MAFKSITLKEEAYERLRALKRPDESFTDVVLRLAGSPRTTSLLEYLRGSGPSEDLAASVERVYSERKRWKFRRVKV